MKLLRLTYLLVFSLCLYNQGYAQLGKNTETVIPYTNEWSLGAIAHTGGFGVNYQKLTAHKDNRSLLWEVSLQSQKHRKEIYLNNPSHQDGSPFVYGKMNSLATFNLSIGLRRIIAERLNNSGIKVNFNAIAGPSIGLIKPIYYLISGDNNNPERTYQKFNPYDEQMQDNIIGRANYFKGINEMGFVPGASGKSSLSFEWGGNDYKYYSLEVGAQVFAYPPEIPIFAFISNQRVFTNFFISANIGLKND